MTPFEKKIEPYKNIWNGYSYAMDVAIESNLAGNELDIFISRNCRVFFFEKHLKVEREGSDQEIRDVNISPLVAYDLSDIQLELLDLFEARMAIGRKFSHRVMKCRRAQVSTLYLAIGYHFVRFSENKKGLVFADRLETARKLRRIIDVFYQTDNLADRPDIGRKTLCEGLYLHHKGAQKGDSSRDSYILIGSGEQVNSGIGGSLDFLHWSEASLTADAQRHWTTIEPSMKGAMFDVAESTPSMTGQDEIIFPAFERSDTYTDCKFISWLDIKDYRIHDPVAAKAFEPNLDHHLYGKEKEVMEQHKANKSQMLWRRFKLDTLKNLTAFTQVYPISKEEAFYASAGLFFHKTIIEMTMPREKEKLNGVPHSFSDQGGGMVSLMIDGSGLWKIYERNSINQNYLIAVDSAEGKYTDKDGRDSDYSVAMVFKLTCPIMEVAMMRERVDPSVLADQVAVAAPYYNNAIVVPERNGPGLAFIFRLMQTYSNVYRTPRMEKGSFISTNDYGYVSTGPSKHFALSSLLQIIRNRDIGLTIQSDVVRQEMGKFAQNGHKFEALPGYHDDTISDLWLMAAAVNQTPYLLTKKDFSEISGQPGSNSGYYKPSIHRSETTIYQTDP